MCMPRRLEEKGAVKDDHFMAKKYGRVNVLCNRGYEVEMHGIDGQVFKSRFPDQCRRLIDVRFWGTSQIRMWRNEYVLYQA